MESRRTYYRVHKDGQTLVGTIAETNLEGGRARFFHEVPGNGVINRQKSLHEFRDGRIQRYEGETEDVAFSIIRRKRTFIHSTPYKGTTRFNDEGADIVFEPTSPGLVGFFGAHIFHENGRTDNIINISLADLSQRRFDIKISEDRVVFPNGTSVVFDSFGRAISATFDNNAVELDIEFDTSKSFDWEQEPIFVNARYPINKDTLLTKFISSFKSS